MSRFVLITGCSSGIGRSLADAFKAAGHDVWACARKPEDVARLATAGFNAVQLDVNDPQALTHLAGQLEHAGGGLDVLRAVADCLRPTLDLAQLQLEASEPELEDVFVAMLRQRGANADA